jgi:ABC-type siderophore export system fused ATPase/permease subunit
MAREALLNTPANGHGRTPVLGGVGSFGQNLATLATLQAKLAALDLKASLASAAPAIAAGFLALNVVVASVILALGAIGWILATEMAWPTAQSLLFVASIAFVLAILVGFVAYQRIQRSLTIFRRSGEELERNIAWIKTVLAQSGHH